MLNTVACSLYYPRNSFVQLLDEFLQLTVDGLFVAVGSSVLASALSRTTP